MSHSAPAKHGRGVSLNGRVIMRVKFSTERLAVSIAKLRMRVWTSIERLHVTRPREHLQRRRDRAFSKSASSTHIRYLFQRAQKCSRHQGHGGEAKDRVSVYVDANATGSLKVPMSMIGKSKRPRCSRTRPSPVKYFAQKKAWSDPRVFQRWWMEVFLPFINEKTSGQVLLLQ